MNVFTKDDVVTAISNDTQAAVYALKTVRDTSGWNSGDAKFAGSLLEQIAKWEKASPKDRYADPLSSRQHEAAVKMLTKYAAVLARVENERRGVDRDPMQHWENAPQKRQNAPQRRQEAHDDERDDDSGERARHAQEERLNAAAALSNNDIPW